MMTALATPISPASIAPEARLFGLVELMSRHAAARLEGRESARITAAIVGHLRALSDAMPASPQVRADAHVWLDFWEHLEQAQATQRTQHARASLIGLLANFSEARV